MQGFFMPMDGRYAGNAGAVASACLKVKLYEDTTYIMTDFSLTVTASPWSTDQHPRALRFGHALLAQDHALKQVFFYQDAVLACQADAPALQWQELAKQSGCSLFLCV